LNVGFDEMVLKEIKKYDVSVFARQQIGRLMG